MTRELRVPATPASLDDVLDLVQELWTCLGEVAGPDRIRFETAVAEVAGNILEHSRAAAGSDGVTVSVRAAADENRLWATLVDDGQALDVDLDAARMPGPDAEDGRGLALARSLSDTLTYERSATANCWTVVCRRRDI